MRYKVRLPIPADALPDMYELMERCWELQPKGRPTFAEMHVMLTEMLKEVEVCACVPYRTVWKLKVSTSFQSRSKHLYKHVGLKLCMYLAMQAGKPLVYGSAYLRSFTSTKSQSIGGSRESAGRLHLPSNGNTYLQVFSPTPERAGLVNVREEYENVPCLLMFVRHHVLIQHIGYIVCHFAVHQFGFPYE